jgi:hypothetical protein
MGLIEINKNPSLRELRWFGVILLAFAGLVGALLRFKFGLSTAATTVWVAGGVIAVAVLAVPPLRKPVYLGWMYAAFPIGWTISNALLAFTYYLVLTPIGLAMRLLGRDPMTRRLDPSAKTYWTEHNPHGAPERYYRQF